AAVASRRQARPIVTTAGDVFRGPHVVAGGLPQETRGILETKREIKDLGARILDERDALQQLTGEISALEHTIGQGTSAVAALHAEQHRQETAIVALEPQAGRAADDAVRVAHKTEQLALEKRQS